MQPSQHIAVPKLI